MNTNVHTRNASGVLLSLGAVAMCSLGLGVMKERLEHQCPGGVGQCPIGDQSVRMRKSVDVGAYILLLQVYITGSRWRLAP